MDVTQTARGIEGDTQIFGGIAFGAAKELAQTVDQGIGFGDDLLVAAQGGESFLARPALLVAIGFNELDITSGAGLGDA